ncbi:DUF3048 domain-containing protein [Clostridium tagluense]|uniref:DUF3048 domain-containing protein n=1 Tax=Clostridium tagluense TaxID=360422 RepID=UPI001C6EB5FA|nr:DUF3048 C-terminal domain-containing protein [Clostridium tagluense]MBW9157537.1 DUF3048 domain-containing protein [Clostridium tagluense]WLC65412.1 DUF3048 domain-containing protein [Clostridium tagluense]
MVKKHFSIVIYLLIAILILILSIFIYRIITHISYVHVNNEIAISKYTGERIDNSYSKKSSKIATYINTSNGAPLIGLSSADVVLEFLSNSSGITYKAIFNQDAAKNISGTVILKDYSNSYLPKFNFSNNIAIADINSRNAINIFITFNEGSSSNFLYQNGEYYHYRGLNIDKDNISPVKFSNVIVQFIHGTIISDETLTSSENQGTGLLFCAGVAQDIKWSRKKSSPIKINDKEGREVSLMPGPTWWIFIDKDCSVAYD